MCPLCTCHLLCIYDMLLALCVYPFLCTCMSFIFNPHRIITCITHCKFVACQFMFTCIVITHTALDAHELIDFSVLLQKVHSWMLLVTPCQQHSSPSKGFTLGNREPIRVRSAQEYLSGLICCVLY